MPYFAIITLQFRQQLLLCWWDGEAAGVFRDEDGMEMTQLGEE